MFCRWRSSYQDGRFGISLTGLTPSYMCVCPKPGHGFPTSNVVVFCCVQWVNMRGDCTFCWYWWNWWPSQFKLSFDDSLAAIHMQRILTYTKNLLLRYSWKIMIHVVDSCIDLIKVFSDMLCMDYTNNDWVLIKAFRDHTDRADQCVPIVRIGVCALWRRQVSGYKNERPDSGPQ